MQCLISIAMKNLICLLTLLGVFACTQAGPYKRLNPEQFEQAISEGQVQLVDVRTIQEFGKGHIESALNVDYLQKSTFREKIGYLDRNKPVYLYCNRGPRSIRSARILEDMGFTEIYDLQGGYQAWLNR